MTPMHRISIAAAAACLWAGVGAGAVEGYNNLPADIRDKMANLTYSLVLGGAKAKDIAQAINDWNVIRVDVDSNLQNRTVREYKLEMGSAADHADTLAKALNVKAWAVRTGIFIGAKPPPPGAGGPPPGGGPPPNGGPPPQGAQPAASAITWSTVGFSTIALAKKPILLFVVDSKATPNQAADYAEQKLFSDAAVLQALNNYGKVKVDVTDKNWDAKDLQKGRGGAVIMLKYFTGYSAFTLDRNSIQRMTAATLVQGLQKVEKDNEVIAERARKAEEAKAAAEKKNEPQGAGAGAGEGEKKPDPLAGAMGLEKSDEGKDDGKKTGQPLPPKKEEPAAPGLAIED